MVLGQVALPVSSTSELWFAPILRLEAPWHLQAPGRQNASQGQVLCGSIS